MAVISANFLLSESLILLSMLKGKKILLCVTGSIAAYKAVYLLRLLRKHGAVVKVIMTKNAATFVSPLTFSTFCGEPVLIELSENENWHNHAILGRWADLMLIAPATSNTLAAMAAGLCNNILTVVYLSAACPVMVVPAMDEDMWNHPATKRNIEVLTSDGVIVLDVDEGELASGLHGKGRMIEPDNIVEKIRFHFIQNGLFQGKKVLVTAGPTVEAIDPVRYISNHSSGKMGVAIAESFEREGGEVLLVHGPVMMEINPAIKAIRVNTAEEMFEACLKHLDEVDVIVMAAAVADYTPIHTSPEKIKKTGDTLSIDLMKTKDILAEAGKRKKKGQILVGFALETNDEERYALDKLEKKNADFIVLNSLKDKGAGFGGDTNKISIFGKNGLKKDFPLSSKQNLASEIVKLISLYS